LKELGKLKHKYKDRVIEKKKIRLADIDPYPEVKPVVEDAELPKIEFEPRDLVNRDDLPP